MLAPNTLLQNRYRIKRQLAQGGMGAIYEAEAVHLGGTVVAVKETFFFEEKLRRQFEREAATLASLRHPSLPKVSDHFSEGAGQFLVMEFIPGKDLLELLEERGRPFEPQFVLEWAEHLLDTLDYIHSQHPPVIHRDIKPNNLKLTPRGELFLLDFGLAKNATTPTRAGGSLRAYTPEYASPEQIRGIGTDARSDLYSLGATLYHLLTGELPPAAQVREAVIKRTGTDPLIDQTVMQTVTPLKKAIIKAMALQREDRFQSAAEMLRELREEQIHWERQAADRLRQEQEQQRAEEERQRRKNEGMLEAERERLQRENAELQRRPLENQQRAEEERRQGAAAPPIMPDAKPFVVNLDERKQPAKAATRSFSRLIVVTGGLAVLIMLAVIISNSNRNTSPAIDQRPSASLPSAAIDAPDSFSFETVRLDATGKEIERKKNQARYYVEDLGNGVTLEMVEIPGGTFTMGSTKAEGQTALAEARRDNKDAKSEWFTAETPRHQVTLPAFFVGRFEVTQAQWRAVMGSDSSYFKGDKLPVESVSWNDVKDFCARLKQRTGRAYRLPSEAEWEYAARAGTTTPFAFGETITPEIVNYNGNYPYASAPKGEYREKTVLVGSLGVPNTFGLYDLHGNVWEWCEDVWHGDYNGAPTDGSAWTTGGDQNLHVLRGGSWYVNGGVCRSAVRINLAPGARGNVVGFRVVVSARTQ